MSVTLAAEDLHVTQSAVSRQLHMLEEMLGVKLFVRGHRSISFTSEGERLFQVADAAVRQLYDVVRNISTVRNRRPVTVSAPTGFAGLWLVPRMGHFQQRHPDINVRISANPRIVDLRQESIDLAIRYCPPDSAPRGAVRLFGESLAPVAHPSLRRHPLDRPEDLRDYFLLELDDFRRLHLQWTDWAAAMGWGDINARGILRFNQYDQVIQAAIAGQGIALGRLELLRTLLREGRLVALSSARVARREYAHWLIQAEASPREDVAAVVNWIRSQASEMESGAPLACAPVIATPRKSSLEYKAEPRH